jgi:hypothetical protein
MYSAPNPNYQLVPYQTMDGNTMSQIQFTSVFQQGAPYMNPNTNHKPTTNFAPTNYSEASNGTFDQIHKAPFYQSKRFDQEEILTPDKPKQRWKREDDKRLFAYLRQYWIESGEWMDEIYVRLTSDPDNHLEFWSYVSHWLSWKGPVSMLQQRFIKLYHMKGLSIREKIFLKKLYDKKKNAPNINIESFLYHFPGRTVQDLIVNNLDRRISEYFSSYKNPEYGQYIKYNAKIFKINKMSKKERRNYLCKQNEFKILINIGSYDTGCSGSQGKSLILPQHKSIINPKVCPSNVEAYIVD